ncbi:MAG: PAS domain-containing protein [Thermomicrobiales bacterium]
MDRASAPAYISPQIEQITGFAADDLMTDRDFLLPLVHPDDRAGFIEENARSDATLEPFHVEVRIRHRDGHWVWISNHATITRGPEGNPTGWQGVIVDITATRSAQERLRTSQRMYGALVSTIPAITYRCPPDALGTSRFDYLSPQASLLLGYDLDTLLAPGTLRSLIHPDDLQAHRENAAAGADAGQSISLYRIRSADGRWHWLRDEAVLIRNEFGAPVSWHGVAFDITAEKEAAVRVGEAEARYHAIVDHIPAFTYIMHPGAIRSWRFSYLSPKLESLLGYPAGAFPTEGARMDDFFNALIHPDDLGVMDESIDDNLAAGSDRIIDFYRLRAFDGTWRWIRDEAALIRDDAGHPLYWHAAGLDVTAEREAERRVTQAENRYRGLIDNLPAGVLLSSAPDRDDIVYASPGAAALFGRSTEEITADPFFLTHQTHPEDQQRFSDAITTAFSTSTPWTGETRVRGAGDRWIWVRTDIRLVHDPAGKPLHWQGLVFDITAQKEAQLALIEQESLFRAAFLRGGVGMNVTDPDENFVDANPAMCAFLGYTHEELLTMNFRQIAHPDDLAEDVARHRQLLAGEIDDYQIEMRYLRKDGSIVWGLAEIALVRDADGAVRLTLGQVQGITDRRLDEAALKLRG